MQLLNRNFESNVKLEKFSVPSNVANLGKSDLTFSLKTLYLTNILRLCI